MKVSSIKIGASCRRHEMTTILNADLISIEKLRARHFTDDACDVLENSIDIALNRKLHGPISDIVVLFSMLNRGKKLGLLAIEACGADITAMHKHALKLLHNCAAQGSDLDFSSIARVADRAYSISLREASSICGDRASGSSALRITRRKRLRRIRQISVDN